MEVLQFGIVCEGEEDRATGGDLADRVCCESIPWLEPELLAFVRLWRGLRTGQRFLRWDKVRDEAKACRVKEHGFFGGVPGEPDAAQTRLAVMLFHENGHRPDALVILRDTDDDPRRRAGVAQAISDATERLARRSPSPTRFPIVLGIASPKREAWVLAGFVARTDGDRDRLADCEKRLGFDPTLRPDRLEHSEKSPKSAKRACAELTGGDSDREAACWRETSLDALRSRGETIGLKCFLDEVERHLVPLVTGYNAPRSAP